MSDKEIEFEVEDAVTGENVTVAPDASTETTAGAEADVDYASEAEEQEVATEETEEKALSEEGSSEAEDDSDGDADKQSLVQDGKDMVKNVFHGIMNNDTIREALANAREDDSGVVTFSLSKTLGGDILSKALQKRLGMIALVCVFFIIYINSRYQCQKIIVEINKTQEMVVKARYKATVCTSRLTEESRESHIMELLDVYGDSTLTIPSEPPYLITVPEEDK